MVKSKSDLIRVLVHDRDTKILQSSVSNFISEYRCFILRGELIGCKNYTGDFTVLPDFDDVNSCIKDYQDTKTAPISYTLDFGITDEGETQLIEINDGLSFASYGLNNVLFCKMIESRWQEITR